MLPGSVKADSVILALKLKKTNFTVEARICGQDWYSASVAVINSDPGGGEVTKLRVQSLSPYTCYEFLLLQWEAGAVAGGGWCPLKSPVSPPVRTEGSGLPSSPPRDLGHQTAPQAQHQHHLPQTCSSQWKNVSQNMR